MAIVLTGTKTVTQGLSPALTAAVLTALLATPIEQLTVAQLKQLNDATKRIKGGHAPGAALGTLFQ
jgi:hypothetical protein